MISMASSKTITRPQVRPFVFESFGVVIRINGNKQEMVDEGARVARESLVNLVSLADGKKIDHLFEINHSKNGYEMFLNGEGLASCPERKKFFKFFDAIVRITVGEHAVDRVFMHAGAVGWKGRAILLPGQSFQGKSTLTAELVRQGAEYYSDDFAIFDKDGLLHPFPRIITMRTDDGEYWPYEMTVESLGGTTATEPLPVGLVLFAKYAPGEEWKPDMLTSGQGLLEMIPFVLPLRREPEFSMRVLKSIATRAIIARSPRGDAKRFAELLLNFVDKNVN
jgi:hypothetical protein